MPSKSKVFGRRQTPTHTQAVSIFRKRQESRGVVWSDVDLAGLMQMMALCIAEDVAVMISSASGGRGVCLKLYRGRGVPDTEYASTAEELNELIAQVVDALDDSQEDGSRSDAAD